MNLSRTTVCGFALFLVFAPAPSTASWVATGSPALALLRVASPLSAGASEPLSLLASLEARPRPATPPSVGTFGLRPWLAALSSAGAPLHSIGANGPLPATSSLGVPGPMWRWPLEGGRPTVLRGFDPPPQPWMPGHRGVDLAPAAGDVVVAAGAGVIRFAGVVVDRPVVSISHADGLITTYEPVAPLVSAGDTVTIGQPIGFLLVGHAGCALACLHWGLRRGASYLDPLALIGRVRVRLLPLP